MTLQHDESAAQTEPKRPSRLERFALRITFTEIPEPPSMDRYRAVLHESERLDSLFNNTVKNWRQILDARVRNLERTTKTILQYFSGVSHLTSHFQKDESSKASNVSNASKIH